MNYNIDSPAEFQSPQDEADFLNNLLMPGWAVQYASPEARQRTEDWTMTAAAARCIHCGRPALDVDGRIAPASWAARDPSFKPHCAECTESEMRPE